MFNLEKSIKKWLKSFRKHDAFNHGSIREMELHLRDHIDDLLSSGKGEEEAFEEAVKEFGEIPPMAEEEYSNLRRNTTLSYLLSMSMFNNYFKTAFRNFKRHRFYAFVNIIGLTIGLTVVLLIGLFVTDELSYDQFHSKKNELFRVVENQYYAGQPVFPVAVTPTALGPSLMAEYPEVVRFTRVSNENARFEIGEKKILERGGIMVDEHFFEMFSFPLISGSISSFKAQLNGLILNEELAEKYFPNENPIGQTIKLNDTDFVVTSVIKNVPNNSHLEFRFIMNFEHFIAEKPDRANSWGSNWLYTYVELEPSAQFTKVNEKIKEQIKANIEGSVTDIYLQPLTDIYLGDVNFTVEVSRKGEMMYVRIFSIIAVFILIISCINFMNLSTARSLKRAKEVGLRKTIGANRKQLIAQFLSESVLLSIIAMVLAVVLVVALLPYFNQMTDKAFDLERVLDLKTGVKILFGILVAAIVTGLLAGSYPALFLSSIRPAATLNNQGVSVKQGSSLRKTLVTLQFVISVILIIGTLVVYKQLQFIQDVNLGYNRNNIVYTYALKEKAEVFADELRKQRGIVNVGLSNRHPAYVMSSSSGFSWPGKDPNETILIHNMRVDENYMSTMEMKLVEGRGFFNSDTAAVIINERAREIMGLENPIGQMITRNAEFKIVGVVADFNFKSIHTAIEPLMMFKNKGLNRVYIKYEDLEEANISKTVEKVWNDFFPDREFDCYFLDKDFNRLYDAEQRTSKLSTYFSLLAIIISCLGLFGLVSYATEQRTKEIGIRKVLGASVSRLFMLLTFDFMRLVLISLVIAIPIGWYFMNEWLDNYAYRIDLSVEIFVLSGLMAIVIGIATVSYQSIKTSMGNPVAALKSE